MGNYTSTEDDNEYRTYEYDANTGEVSYGGFSYSADPNKPYNTVTVKAKNTPQKPPLKLYDSLPTLLLTD